MPVRAAEHPGRPQRHRSRRGPWYCLAQIVIKGGAPAPSMNMCCASDDAPCSSNARAVFHPHTWPRDVQATPGLLANSVPPGKQPLQPYIYSVIEIRSLAFACMQGFKYRKHVNVNSGLSLRIDREHSDV